MGQERTTGAPTPELRAATDGVDGLTFDRRGRLPAVCFKCGTAEGIKYRHDRLEHDPLWAAVLNWSLFFSRTYEVRIPLCGPCNDRWWRARVVPLAALFVGYAALFGAFFWWWERRPADAETAAAFREGYLRHFLPLLVGWLAMRTAGILALRAAARRWRLRVVRRQGDLVTVETVHALAREAAVAAPPGIVAALPTDGARC